MSKLITEKDALLAAFPYSLTRDTDKVKLADAVASELIKTVAQSEYAAVFPRVDELPEKVLDILAADLKIQWYEIDAPIWNKRQTVKECMLVHKYKGTKYAVEAALRSMYNSAEVKEWFEYGGEPFHFQVKVYGSNGSGLKTLYLKIQYAKNLRSVMDDVKFVLIPEKEIDAVFGAQIASIKKRIGMELISETEDIYSTDGISNVGISLTARLKKIPFSFRYECGPPCGTSGAAGIGFAVSALTKRYSMRLIEPGIESQTNKSGNNAGSLRFVIL